MTREWRGYTAQPHFSAMGILVLSAQDVKRALPMKAAIEATRAAFSSLADGEVELPQRLALAAPEQGALTLVMPARTADALGTKIVSVFPSNAERGRPAVSGIVVLLDHTSGEPRAVIEGGALTAIRTGAASGLATDLLAPPDARRVAVIGAGVQARTQLEAVCAVRSIESVVVYSLTGATAVALAEEMAGLDGVPESIEVADSVAEAVASADVICAATSSSSPVLASDDLPGSPHINAIGSFTPEMREIDPALLARSRVVVDDVGASMEEAGEVIAAVKAGLISRSELVELGDIVTGRTPAVVKDGRPTVFKSVGLAVQDVSAAARAVTRAREDGLGVLMDFADA